MKREPKKTESLEVRLAPETKSAFMAACRANGASASRVLRRFIDQYLLAASRASHRNEEPAMNFIRRHRRRAFAAAAAASIGSALVWAAVPARAAADERVAAVFEWFDASRDGRVTRDEFDRTMDEDTPSLGALELIVDSRVPPPEGETRDALFRRLDANGDGSLDLAELDSAVVVRTVASADIAAADENRDGALTEGELAAYLTARRAAAGRADPAAGVGLMARGIVAAHDRDEDGRVAIRDLLR